VEKREGRKFSNFYFFFFFLVTNSTTEPSKMARNAARYVYVGLLVSLAVAIVGFPQTGQRFVLRPSWCPASVLLLIVRLGKWIPAAAALHLVIAAAHPDNIGARIAAALFFSTFALQHHSIVSTHYEQLAHCGLWALVLPPGSARGSILRILVAHHIGAAGFLKAYVGGKAWADPLTMVELCKEFAPHPAVLHFAQHGPKLLLYCIGWGGLICETFIFPCAVLMVQDHRNVKYVFWSLCLFHTGTFVLVSMFFVHNLAIYAAALFLDPPSATSPATWALLLILSILTITAVEDWPLSHMGLFPYSARQIHLLKSQFGDSLRLIGSALNDTAFVGKELRDSGAVDIIAWTLHASVPTSVEEWEGDGRFGVATFWAKSWLDLEKIDLKMNPNAAIDAAALSIGVSKIMWDTVVGKPIVHFYGARVEKGADGRVVIKELISSTDANNCLREQ
jgi:hypothetical protein